MNSRQKIVQQRFLNNEKAVIDELETTYGRALKDVQKKIKKLSFEVDALQGEIEVFDGTDEEREVLQSKLQAKIYQKRYQEALHGQLDTVLDKMNEKQFNTVSDYLKTCYDDGYIGTLYDLQGQGIPLATPMNQENVVRAVQTDSKISQGLYTRMGEDVDLLKKNIAAEVSRGLVTGATYDQIAKQIQYKMVGTEYGKGGALSRAKTIARTEGHRIQNVAAMDACNDAKEAGADVVKQWDATLDGKTRESHSQVDGEIKELDEAFSNGLQYPGDSSGGAAEVVNCRCALLRRARWAVKGGFTKMNNFTKEIETFESPADYDEFKKAFFSKENKQFMNYHEMLEERHGTKNFEKLLGSMTDEEYKHWQKLYNNSPIYNKAAKSTAEAVKKPAFTPAKSVDEANTAGSKIMAQTYERHRIDNNLCVVSYDDMSDPGDLIYADYGKMSVESANVFNSTLSDLIDEYDTPLYKIRTMTKEEYMFQKNSFAFVSHNYTVDSAELVINPIKCKNIDELSDRIKELSNRGYCVNIPDELAERYVATHEFAHTIINVQQPLKNSTNFVNADYAKIKKARQEIENVHRSYMSEIAELTKTAKDTELTAILEPTEESFATARKAKQALDAAKISNYSLTDIDEFMAESFANEKLGTASNKYSKQVVDIIDKYFKR